MTASTFPFSEAELKEWIAQSVAEVFRERADELIAQKLAAFVTENERRARELALMERVVRVEEELKTLREVQTAHFQVTEKRFEALQREITARFAATDKRFEAVDKRFEAMDKRFEAMDKRFTTLQWTMGLGFSLLVAWMSLLKFWP
ncbi:hypothetical protein [Desulfosoma sp.]|uniref:hypothetical protein n=1 Tax=Desulfosoma sp. TaxID=2603217 RepID=UPI004049C227